jgi:hypothetical protein
VYPLSLLFLEADKNSGERAMLVWGGLLVVLGIATLLIAIYALVTRSAGVYQTTRQFWTVLLVSAGISYLLSSALFLFAGVSAAAAVIVSAIVPFLVGNVFSKGDVYGGESASHEQPEEVAEETEDADDEDTAGAAAILADDHDARFARFSDLLN